MKQQKLFYLLVLASVLALSGCVARTYPLTRDRVDQDLSVGNRGFLMGSAPAENLTLRKNTRTVRVFEFEFGKTYPTAKQAPISAPLIADKESLVETAALEPLAVSTTGQKYTVGKKDTLQKISKKFYGTSKNWMKIYNANKNTLKGPNNVYPGQVLNIPEISNARNTAESLKEQKENLK